MARGGIEAALSTLLSVPIVNEGAVEIYGAALMRFSRTGLIPVEPG